METTALYPGQVLLEGTNLSEGRGTTMPFAVIGAPFLDGHALAAELSGFNFPGVVLRAVRFRPTFDKWANQMCEGIRIHVTDMAAVRSFALTITLLRTIRKLHGNQMQWLDPPYEYEYERMPIDILYGSDRLREVIDESGDSAGLDDCDREAWMNRIADVRLYPGAV